MHHDHVLIKSNFDLPTPSPGSGGGGGGMWAKYLLTCCCIRASFKFDMQHKHVLRKLNFYLLTPSPGSGGVGGVGGGGSLGQNICYHVAAFVILFNLICSMTVFEKVEFGPFDHIPKSSQGVRHRPSIEIHV